MHLRINAAATANKQTESPMKTQFYSDSGAPCWKCAATLHEYTVDDCTSLVDVFCYTCHSRDVFARRADISCASQASAEHRARSS
jgi:hypothetical protein